MLIPGVLERREHGRVSLGCIGQLVEEKQLAATGEQRGGRGAVASHKSDQFSNVGVVGRAGLRPRIWAKSLRRWSGAGSFWAAQ